jgi:hypothetical protein
MSTITTGIRISTFRRANQERRRTRKERSLFHRPLHERNPVSWSHLQHESCPRAGHVSGAERRRLSATKANQRATNVYEVFGPASTKVPVQQSAQKAAASTARIGNVNAPKSDQPVRIACERTMTARMANYLEPQSKERNTLHDRDNCNIMERLGLFQLLSPQGPWLCFHLYCSETVQGMLHILRLETKLTLASRTFPANDIYLAHTLLRAIVRVTSPS